ncbi:MAG: hypothetical protein KatS3mg032_1491 [Cyclobacteriaceae bacterium]|nr:MAG: hypothetical protein KatS3mg032_1491 [Cyclobacteriaceae bacterium]
MRPLVVFILFFTVCRAHAQNGTYMLRHYQPGGEAAGQTVFDIAQDNHGLMYFAVQRGVLRFDSRNWDLLQTGGAVYDLWFDNNTLFTAGWNGAGKIALHNPAEWRFEQLKGAAATSLFRVTGTTGQLFFGNDRFIYEYANDTLKQLTAERQEWVALLTAENIPYVSSGEGKTFVLKQNNLVPVAFAPLHNTAVIFAETHHQHTLFGTDEGRLFVLESGKYLRTLKLADSAYARASVVVSACWITPDLVALGTLRGGVMFVNPLTGHTEQIINYASGLPDNEILALAADRNRNVWVAHRYGITRIMPFIPLRSFAHYPGLEGTPLCAERFNGTLYTGTALGLYRLDREDRYEELVYYVEVPVTVKPAGKTQANETRAGKEKSGWFGFLKRRKPAVQPDKSENNPVITEYKVTYRREKRTLRMLRASEYVFRKVQGIDARISGLQVWNGRLLASGMAGLWEISENRAQLLLDEPVRYLLTRPGNITAISHDGKVHRMQVLSNQTFRAEADSTIFDATYVLPDADSTTWICTTSRLYEIKNHAIRSLPIANPDYDAVYGVMHHNHLLFTSSGRVWALDSRRFALTPVDSLSGYTLALPDAGRIWLRFEDGWKVLGQDPGRQQLSYLSIIPDIAGIHTAQHSGNLWITTSSGELIYFRQDALLPVTAHFPLLIRRIKINETPVEQVPLPVRLIGENNAVQVQVVLPEYNMPEAVKYRYRLAGLVNTWSDWSPNHAVLDFPFLPEGKYRLEVQAQTPDGYTTNIQTLPIAVLPPYWKRWWFYALEFGVFSLLVLSSFRLSNRYRIVSRILSLLSIIILIEFIQTVAGTSLQVGGGPVAEFLIQVMIAFIILPVEGYLRNIMLRSIEKNQRL